MAIRRILVAEDDVRTREILTDAVRSLGLTPIEANSAAEALERIRDVDPDLVLADGDLRDESGSSLLQLIHDEFPDVPSVLLSAANAIESAAQALGEGAIDFISEPFSSGGLEAVFDRLDRTIRLMREVRYLRSQVVGLHPPTWITHSQGMVELLRTASRVARSKGTVLIHGEQGVGKRLLARHVHRCSSRAGGPFLCIAANQVHVEELEHELFGSDGEKLGSRMVPGALELADGGTLVLEDIGELPAALQARLVRFLEDESFERGSSSRTLRSDVRIIATTSRKLAQEVAEGRMREELKRCLEILPLSILSLRDRREDILPLAELIAEEFAKEESLPVPSLSVEAKQRLTEWHWPDNVRELRRVVNRAVLLLAGRDTIEAQHLVFEGSGAALVATEDSVDPEVALARQLANRPMAEIERIAMLSTIEASGGNKTEAARRLGVTARTISNKMKIWRAGGFVE